MNEPAGAFLCDRCNKPIPFGGLSITRDSANDKYTYEAHCHGETDRIGVNAKWLCDQPAQPTLIFFRGGPSPTGLFRPHPTDATKEACMIADIDHLDLQSGALADLDRMLTQVFAGGHEGAAKWLKAHSDPCGGKPIDLLQGKVPGVERDAGTERVLRYLRMCA